MVSVTQKVPVIVRTGENTSVAKAAADRAEAAAALTEADVQTSSQLVSNLTPYIEVSETYPELLRITGPIEIYDSVDTGDEIVPISLPEELTIRELGRDESEGNYRFRLRIAAHDNGVYTPLFREVGNSFYLVTNGFVGKKYIELKTIDDSLGVPSDTTIGWVPVDFGNGETFGTYTGLIPYTEGGLKVDRLQPSPTIINSIQNTIGQDIRLTGSDYLLPFIESHDESGSWSSTADPEFLLKFIKDIRLYAPKNKEYRVGYVQTTHPRFINIVEHATGRTVCQAYIPLDEPFPAKIKAGRGALGLNENGWKGAYAILELDPDIAETVQGSGNYGTMTMGGIDPSVVYGPDEVRALLRAQSYKHYLKCGTGLEFETVTELNDDSRCQLANPHELVKVEFAAETFEGSDFIRPEFCFWYGQGIDRTVFSSPSSATTATVQSYLDGGEYYFTAHTDANQYPIHCETSSLLWGGEGQERPVFKFRHCVKLSVGTGHDTNLIGGGIGAMVEVENDTILRYRTSATDKADFSWHNTAALPNQSPNFYNEDYTKMAHPARVTLRNCPEADGVKTTGADANFISLIPDSDPGVAPTSIAVFYGNEFTLAQRSITNASQHQWQLLGSGVTEL